MKNKNTTRFFPFFFGVFILANFLLSSFYIDTWQTWNTTSRVLSVLAVCHNGTLQIDEFHERTQDKCFVNGHYYSEKAPLPAFITIPFYYPIKSPGDLIADQDGFIGKPAYILGGIICGSIPFVFIISVLFFRIHKENTEASPILLTMLPFYGSFLFVYAGVFLNHLPGAALLLSSYILLKDRKKFFLSGFFCGLAFLSDFPLGIALPIWAFQIYFNEKSFKNSGQFIWGFLPSLLFLFTYNYFITGHPFKMLYQFVSHEGFASTRETLGFASLHLDALWKMMFTTYRGVLIYFPMLLFLLLMGIKKIPYTIKKIPSSYVWGFAISHYLIISAHEMWWGGWCVGPRHLIPSIVLLAFEGLKSFYKINSIFSKCIFWVLAFAGLLSTWLFKATVGYTISNEFQNPLTERIIPLFRRGFCNQNNILTMCFDFPAKNAAYIWLTLFVFICIFLNLWYKRYFIARLNE